MTLFVRESSIKKRVSSLSLRIQTLITLSNTLSRGLSLFSRVKTLKYWVFESHRVLFFTVYAHMLCTHTLGTCSGHMLCPHALPTCSIHILCTNAPCVWSAYIFCTHALHIPCSVQPSGPLVVFDFFMV